MGTSVVKHAEFLICDCPEITVTELSSRFHVTITQMDTS